ncbi:MAG: class I SAM-dependent methyltransferase [Deltaproteobacteria bacterium]|nr:MAG: class I SAM-dependent methyltransferase [Deltaproteobacteria bacterium]
MPLEERKIKEIEHSDRRRSIVRAYEYRTDASPDQSEGKYVEGEREFERHFSNMKFYSITRSSTAYRDALLLEGIRGAVALDYCCGNGEVAVDMALRGASKVVGIDISPVAIENARGLARSAGVDAVCEFKVMDAEHTGFADGTFDLIHEYGALHHLDLPAAYEELARILKPGGKVICTEALRHNPLIRWYRKRTPQLRTQWEVEHILGVQDLERARKNFGDVRVTFFHLAVLAAVPFRKTVLFKSLSGLLERIDSVILGNRTIGKYGWIMVFAMRQPGRRQG